ncbi:MAG: hypothetical protein GXP29_06880, partial [Planctomycetes bacterium]|nr:hypothetical protein [Planctomycetota bacterium]
AEPPILYSVGSNGFDEGGKFTLKKRGTVDWEQFDLVFFLDGDRPRRDP